jgi:signal peptidase I
MSAIVVLLPLTAWVAVDTARRGRCWFAWAALVSWTGVMGLAIWLARRRRFPVVMDRIGFLRTTGLTLVGLAFVLNNFAIVTYIITFLFQMARVEGQAMAPTLEHHDSVIVNKLVYRTSAPRRGDIVMLYYPLNPDKLFVQRVIAEEGDAVRIVDGRVYVNDVPMRDDFVPPEYRSHDDFGPTVIPEGYYFVMGDHRNNSLDSRHWGMVPKKYIIGKVTARWSPIRNARVF